MSLSSPTFYQSATDLAEMIRQGSLSALECVDLHLERVQHVNPMVNALCSLVPDQARARARQIDRRIAAGDPVGPLAGLPIAIKDLVLTKGIRTTMGSPIYKDFVPKQMKRWSIASRRLVPS